MDHTNYVFCKSLKIYNRNTLTRSSYRIFNPMRYTGEKGLKIYNRNIITRSSYRIFNPMRFIGCIYDHAHSFFWEDF